jgi:hypothetical protein
MAMDPDSRPGVDPFESVVFKVKMGNYVPDAHTVKLIVEQDIPQKQKAQHHAKIYKKPDVDGSECAVPNRLPARPAGRFPVLR